MQLPCQTNLSNDYFKNRIENLNDEEKEEAKPPVVKLEFTIGEHAFTIERHITENVIKEFSIDGSIYNSEEYDNLDEAYEGELLEKSGVESLEDLAFILQLFLIRVEEGNYLLWDNKGGDQARLIRLIINQAGFEKKYQELAKKVKTLDSTVRGTQDTKAQVEKRVKALRDERELELAKNKKFVAKTEIESKLKKVQTRLDELKDVHGKCTRHLDTLKENLKKINNQIDNLSLERDNSAEETASLENQYYRYIYSDNKVLIAINKLKLLNQCIYCGKNPKEDIATSIIQSVEQQCKCPVCQSKIDGTREDKPMGQEAINKLEELKTFLKDSQIRMNNLLNERRACQTDFENVFKKERVLATDLNIQSVEVYDIKIQLSKVSSNPEEQISKYDSDIKTLENEIKRYEDIITPEKEKFQKAFDKLNENEKIQNKLIEDFEKRLNEIFTSYTTAFFKADCKLETNPRKPKESNIKVMSFVPFFDGTQRWSIERCSTSQRILLEYIFRFSLMELYEEMTGSKGFIIFETSEGAFDITNTKQLAELFAKFGKNNIPFIAISNFNKEDFLGYMVNSMGTSRKKRVLNFTSFSKLTDLQQKDLAQYARISKKLELE